MTAPRPKAALTAPALRAPAPRQVQPGWAVAPPRSAGEARSRLRQFQNEFLDAKLDDAFHRLWRDQAPGPKGEEVNTPEEYLQGYFRQVSALHRECIYSAHRRDLLEQKKLDVECGLIRGSIPDILREIEEAERQHAQASQLIQECMQRMHGRTGGGAAGVGDEQCCAGSAASPCCRSAECAPGKEVDACVVDMCVVQ